MFVAARSWPWPELHPPCRQGLTTCLVSRRCRRVSSLPGGGCPRPGLSKVEGFGPQPSTSHHFLIVGVPCTPTGSLRSARASSLAPLRSRRSRGGPLHPNWLTAFRSRFVARSTTFATVSWGSPAPQLAHYVRDSAVRTSSFFGNS